VKVFLAVRAFYQKIGSIREYLYQLAVYICFVSAYFLLVLHSMNGFLKRVFDTNRVLYAVLALLLIGVQGFALERVTSGLLFAVRRAQNFLSMLLRLVRPHETIKRPAEAPGLLIYRFAGPLFFFNASHFVRRVKELARTADPPVTFFLINAEAIIDVDMAGVEALKELYGSLESDRVVLALCEVKGHFRDVLFNMPGLEGFSVYPSVSEAVLELTGKRL